MKEPAARSSSSSSAEAEDENDHVADDEEDDETGAELCAEGKKLKAALKPMIACANFMVRSVENGAMTVLGSEYKFSGLSTGMCFSNH